MVLVVAAEIGAVAGGAVEGATAAIGTVERAGVTTGAGASAVCAAGVVGGGTAIGPATAAGPCNAHRATMIAMKAAVTIGIPIAMLRMRRS